MTAPDQTPDQPPNQTPARIAALLRKNGVVDGHNDLLWAAREKVGYDFDQLELNDTEACRTIGRLAR